MQDGDAGASGNAEGRVIPELKPGTVVLHPELGAGTIVSNDSDHIEIDFKLRGRRKLVATIVAQVVTVTGFKQVPRFTDPTGTRPVNGTTASKRDGPKAKKKKAKAQALRRKKKQTKRGRKKGLPTGALAGRGGGDRWEWDMTTPNTPLYRLGRR